MKILITGICGFVGSTLAKAFSVADKNCVIYGIDNLNRPGSEMNRVDLRRYGIQFFHGDLRCDSDVETLPTVDWVIDCAANASILAGTTGNINSRQLIEHNQKSTFNLLEYCKTRNAGFILLSTSRVYSIKLLSTLAVTVSNLAFQVEENGLPPGISSNGVREDFSTEPPISLYGMSKLTSEIMALEYGATFGFPVWINRCSNLGGAGQFGRSDQGIFSYWIHAYRNRLPLQYIGFEGKGHQVRDILHPRDLMTLLFKQMMMRDSATKPRIINLGGGTNAAISLRQLSDWCHARFGYHEVCRVAEARQYDIPWMIFDNTLAKKTWDWQPVTTMQDILLEIANHAENNPTWLQMSNNH